MVGDTSPHTCVINHQEGGKNMQEIFDLIYYEGDILKTVCSIFILLLIVELIFGIISIISHAARS